jgi:hypothetical protein
MAAGPPARYFPIRYEAWFRALARVTFLPASKAYLALDGERVIVCMAWGFRTELPRRNITAARATGERVRSWGVHGFGGRWLVNGARDGIVAITIAPAVRASAAGIPIRLAELRVSVDDPEALVAALTLPR